MAYNEAQKRATMKYIKNNYDRIELKVPAGKKIEYQNHASTMDESLNAFIVRAMDEAIARDTLTTKPKLKADLKSTISDE